MLGLAGFQCLSSRVLAGVASAALPRRMANLTILRHRHRALIALSTALLIVALAAPTAAGFCAPLAHRPAAGSARSPRPPNPPARRTVTALGMGNTASGGGGPPSESTRECFAGKSVLLTGASRGLGRSLATRLASCGVSELVLSGRDSEALDGVRAECLRLGPDVKVRVVPCDLADKESVDELAREAIASCDGGAVDVLINNGGISSRSSFIETNFEVDERLMRVNFLSGAQLAKAVAPGMVGRGSGRIVWVSSVQGRIGTPFRTSYAGSKFAVAGYCEALRSELSSRGVAVHVASPGYVRTGLSRSAVTGDGSAYGKTDETTANGADPDDVATYILDSVAAGRTDFVVAATFSARLAIWLKFLAPSFLEKQLVKRYEKQRLESKKTD